MSKMMHRVKPKNKKIMVENLEKSLEALQRACARVIADNAGDDSTIRDKAIAYFLSSSIETIETGRRGLILTDSDGNKTLNTDCSRETYQALRSQSANQKAILELVDRLPGGDKTEEANEPPTIVFTGDNLNLGKKKKEGPN